MTEQRWQQLMNDNCECLTGDEVAESWHFCPENDGDLIRRNWDGQQICDCYLILRPKDVDGFCTRHSATRGLWVIPAFPITS